MRVKATHLLLFVTLFSCKSKSVDQEKHLPLVSLYYSNFPYDPVYLEFSRLNSVKVHSPYYFLKTDTVYSIETADRHVLDSFIHLFTQNTRDEVYYETYPEGEIVDEEHFFNFAINIDSIHKSISIMGHTAPRKFYQFTSWASSLKYRLENKK
jgi:hypothetical protein